MVKEQTWESGLGRSPVLSCVKVPSYFPFGKSSLLPSSAGPGGDLIFTLLVFCFFFSLWHRKETHRKNSRKINFSLFSPRLCITQPTISEQLPGNSSRNELQVFIFFFLSCISSDDFDYCKGSSGQYSTGMAWYVSPTLVYSELFRSFLNSVAGSCRQRLRRML